MGLPSLLHELRSTKLSCVVLKVEVEQLELVLSNPVLVHSINVLVYKLYGTSAYSSS